MVKISYETENLDLLLKLKNSRNQLLSGCFLADLRNLLMSIIKIIAHTRMHTHEYPCVLRQKHGKMQNLKNCFCATFSMFFFENSESQI